MLQSFVKNGYNIVQFNEIADVYIVNTCTVTNIADKKSRQSLRKVKEINPNAVLVAVGCYAQVAKEELEKIEDIDLILGVNEKKDIVKYVEEFLSNKSKLEVISKVACQNEFIDFGTVTYTEKTRAVIKIQDGCDRFCSYCLIPYARGRIRSRMPDSVLNEVQEIANKGIKEIVLTGIHIASYGKDFKEEKLEKINQRLEEENNQELNQKQTEDYNKKASKTKTEYYLIDLLEDMNKINGIERIRLRFNRTKINYRRIYKKTI